MSAPGGFPRYELSPHPASPPSPVRALGVVATRAGDSLALRYRLEGDLGSLRLPEPRPSKGGSQRVDGLWQHTCFEAFVAGVAATAYREFNFSPSGEWAAYDFDGYRNRRAQLPVVVPAFTSTLAADAFELVTILDVAWLTQSAGSAIRLGVTAVIEDEAGGLSYWALKHPAEKPDFHHADSFVLEIP